MPRQLKTLARLMIASTMALATATAFAQSRDMQTTAATTASLPGTQYDFAYRSSDHRVNVFDDGRDTRLQMPEGTLVPTVVVIQPKGEVVLKAHREDPYLVVPGLHQQIRLRWANSREVAVSYTGIAQVTQRLGQAASFGSNAPIASHGSVAAPQAARAQGTVVANPTTERIPAMPMHTALTDASNKVAVSAQAPALQAAQSTTTFSVARTDRTIREALVKWSRMSGWTFEPEHWVVARDIPVAGGASVDADFKTAVRMLLRSTELTDLPVQPCFYNSNMTLRVVPINDSCTRGN